MRTYVEEDSYDKNLVEMDSRAGSIHDVSKYNNQQLQDANRVQNNYYTSVEKKSEIHHHIIDHGDTDSGTWHPRVLCVFLDLFNRNHKEPQCNFVCGQTQSSVFPIVQVPRCTVSTSCRE